MLLNRESIKKQQQQQQQKGEMTIQHKYYFNRIEALLSKEYCFLIKKKKSKKVEIKRKTIEYKIGFD
jgi:hypothetical protein